MITRERRDTGRRLHFRGARFALMACAALGVAGCESDLPKGTSRKVVQLSEVPESVMKVAKSRLPDIEFKDSWQNLDAEKKLHSYEIRGRAKNGKIREVRISPSGEVLELE